MTIKVYKEKDIRKSLLRKAPGHTIKFRKHDRLNIEVDGIKIATIKVPNNHSKTKKHSFSVRIATKLKLNDDDYMNFVDCKMTGPQYLELLKEKTG